MAKSKDHAKKVGGPFLAAAIFCESFLDDTSGKISAIGIMDGCNIVIAHDAPPDAPSKANPAVMTQNMLVILRSGDAPGKHKMKLVLETPDGKRASISEKEVELSQPPHGGINIKTHAMLAVHTSGVFWIDVFLDGKRVTRIPLNVTFQRLPPPPGASPAKSSAKKK